MLVLHCSLSTDEAGWPLGYQRLPMSHPCPVPSGSKHGRKGHAALAIATLQAHAFVDLNSAMAPPGALDPDRSWAHSQPQDPSCFFIWMLLWANIIFLIKINKGIKNRPNTMTKWILVSSLLTFLCNKKCERAIELETTVIIFVIKHLSDEVISSETNGKCCLISGKSWANRLQDFVKNWKCPNI